MHRSGTFRSDFLHDDFGEQVIMNAALVGKLGRRHLLDHLVITVCTVNGTRRSPPLVVSHTLPFSDKTKRKVVLVDSV